MNELKNFPFTHEGKTYWYSRSMAVSTFIFTEKEHKLHILLAKRGKGCPDFNGYWSAPCGYLDHNETLAQAASRECFEEIGLKISNQILIPMEVNSDFTENKQNVTQRYMAFIPYNSFTESEFSTLNSEKDEVEAIEWVDVNNLSQYEIAFNHKDIIESYINCAKILAIINKLTLGDIKTPYSSSNEVIEIYDELFVTQTIKNVGNLGKKGLAKIVGTTQELFPIVKCNINKTMLLTSLSDNRIKFIIK